MLPGREAGQEVLYKACVTTWPHPGHATPGTLPGRRSVGCGAHVAALRARRQRCSHGALLPAGLSYRLLLSRFGLVLSVELVHLVAEDNRGDERGDEGCLAEFRADL